MNKLLRFNTCDSYICTKLANLSLPPNLRTQVIKKIEKYFESSKSQIKRLAGNGKSTNEEGWGVSLKITMEVVHLSLGLYTFTYNILYRLRLHAPLWKVPVIATDLRGTEGTQGPQPCSCV